MNINVSCLAENIFKVNNPMKKTEAGEFQINKVQKLQGSIASKY